MASSTLSLDSLSSPSPSPSPPPLQSHLISASTTSTAKVSTTTAPALDTDSELSELTDDDQDASALADKRLASKTTPSSFKPNAGHLEGGDDDPALLGSLSTGLTKRGKHQRSLSSRRGGGGRKKRSSLVPAPMWGWAESKAPASTTPLEEEEEEDIADPPRAMEEEEEEEEEEGDDGDDDDLSRHGEDAIGAAYATHAGRAYNSSKRPAATSYNTVTRGKFRPTTGKSPNKSSTFHSRRAGLADPHVRQRSEDQDGEEGNGSNEELDKPEKFGRQSILSSKRVSIQDDEDEDDHIPPNGDGIDDDSGSDSEYTSTRRKRPLKARSQTSKKRKGSGGEDNSVSDDYPVSSRKKRNRGRAQQKTASNHRDTNSNRDYSTESEVEGHAAFKPTFSASLSKPMSTSASIPLSSLADLASASASASASTEITALSTLAALADAVDIAPSSSQAVPINTITSGSNTSGGPSPSEKSGITVVSAGAARIVSASSGSSSHNPEDEPDPSEDESKALKGRGRGGKVAVRGGRVKGRGGKSAIAVVSNGRETSTSGKSPNTKKGPPPPLDLKASTTLNDPNGVTLIHGDDVMDIVEDVPQERPNEDDISMDADEHEEEEEEEDDGEGAQSTREEEEEVEHIDEAAEGDQDAEEEAVDGDGEEGEGEGDDDHENEDENDPDAAEPEPDNEGEENGDNDEEPSHIDVDADAEDHESDLQPAHRAEALDVLATIELKFALLRERVYVEKMDGLAWEESLVQSGAHPEMLHLQKELSTRRDKRLELASRKRSYEVANAITRRKADEAGVWSWWKVARDELQTEMIAEANRKRRRLERERRSIDRPQPVRRIPLPPHIDIHNLPALPNLRKILKTYPFGNRKHLNSDNRQRSRSQYPRSFVYPEISTLSANDIMQDLEFLFQNRRLPTVFDIQQQPHIPPSQPSFVPPFPPPRNGSGVALNISSSAGMPTSRPSTLGMVNGNLTPQAPVPSVGLSHSTSATLQPQHGMGYDQFAEIPQFGTGGQQSSVYGRTRDPLGGSYPPSGGPLSINSRDSMNHQSLGGRTQPSHSNGPSIPHPHGYPGDHEVNGIGLSSNSMNPGGHGQQVLPHHPYFGAGNSTGPNLGSGNIHPPSLPPMPTNNAKGTNGRRSISPVHVILNAPPGGSKTNGNWVGPGMGMGGFPDTRMSHEEEERERMMRERDRDRKNRDDRDVRDRDKEREFIERERYRQVEMDRSREQQHVQQQQQHQQQYRPGAPASSSTSNNLSHPHNNGTNALPTQGLGVAAHHHTAHHHHRHHHHVVHHHHSQGQGPQHASSSLPPSSGAAIIHSPRSNRDYDNARPPMHQNSISSHPLPTEVINLSSAKSSQPSTNNRERDGPSHWPTRSPEHQHQHLSHVDFRERDMRKAHNHRHGSGPPMMPQDDRNDRPMATPFVMASSQTMQQSSVGIPSGSHINGSGMASSTSSPRGPSWNTPTTAEDASYRMTTSVPPPSNFPTSRDPHPRSPVQGHRYATTSSHVPPLSRMAISTSSSVIHHRMGSPPLPSSNRVRPPSSPPYAMTSQRSPITSPKSRTLSPLPNGGSKQLPSGPLPGLAYSSSPHLSGPGRIPTPVGHHPSSSTSLPPLQSDVVAKNSIASSYGNRTASPLMSSLHGSSTSSTSIRAPTNGSSSNGLSSIPDRDKDRERHMVSSPRLNTSSVTHQPPSSKLSA